MLINTTNKYYSSCGFSVWCCRDSLRDLWECLRRASYSSSDRKLRQWGEICGELAPLSCHRCLPAARTYSLGNPSSPAPNSSCLWSSTRTALAPFFQCQRSWDSWPRFHRTQQGYTVPCSLPFLHWQSRDFPSKSPDLACFTSTIRHRPIQSLLLYSPPHFSVTVFCSHPFSSCKWRKHRGLNSRPYLPSLVRWVYNYNFARMNALFNFQPLFFHNMRKFTQDQSVFNDPSMQEYLNGLGFDRTFNPLTNGTETLKDLGFKLPNFLPRYFTRDTEEMLRVPYRLPGVGIPTSNLVVNKDQSGLI